MKSFILLPAAGLGLALAACGSLDANTSSAPALATLSGSLTNPQAVALPEGAVRVAVVWQAANGFNVAEDLPVQPVFPSSFTIQLDDPPPASAMTDASDFFGSATPTAPTGANGSAPTTQNTPTARTSSELQVALGAVVAYVDKNGNGKLDLVPTGASGYVDQILATNATELVVYFQGTIPSGAADDLGHAPSPGYNIHSGCDVSLPISLSPGSLCKTPPDAGPPQPTCYEEWLPITSPITLAVATDPQVNSLMCQNAQSGSENAGASQSLPGRPATYPAVCDPNLGCAPDGSSYTYGSCQTVQTGICEGTEISCTSVSYSRPSPVPSDWPCTP